jgi:alpha-1,2-mannosyltransferase
LSSTFFRDAPWLTRNRIRAYTTILITGFAGVLAWLLLGHGNFDPGGRPVGTDFVSFWTVSWALLHGEVQAVYSATALPSLEQRLIGPDTPFYAWFYPPVALLIVYPLALVPYLWALALWLIAGLTAYLAALWRILPQTLTIAAGLAFPAVFLTITHGQNALISASILTWGLLLLNERPVVAGIVIACLSFKPQLAVLVPVALVAGGHWRAIAAAAFTCFGLVLVATLLFGSGIWQSFVAVTSLAGDVLDQGLVPYYKMQSVYAAVRLLGGGATLAYAAQGLAALGAAAFLVWTWRQPSDRGLQNAALMAAVPLATPFLLDYDLVCLAPAILWIARKATREGPIPWENATLAAVCIDPLLARTFAQYTHLSLTPFVVIALLVAIARRIGVDRAAVSRHQDQGSLNASTTWSSENS